MAIKDPWGRLVTRGQYAYRSRSNSFIRIVPAGNKEQIVPEARTYLKGRSTHPLSHLVLNKDSDADITDEEPERKTLKNYQESLELSGNEFDRQGDLILENNGKVSLAHWETQDEQAEWLPNQQKLERLVCASIVAAYPERGKEVKTWLASRTEPPSAGVKEFAWSYMAGWYGENGCDDFYRAIWRDGKVRIELEERLKSGGIWRIAEEIAG